MCIGSNDVISCHVFCHGRNVIVAVEIIAVAWQNAKKKRIYISSLYVSHTCIVSSPLPIPLSTFSLLPFSPSPLPPSFPMHPILSTPLPLYTYFLSSFLSGSQPFAPMSSAHMLILCFLRKPRDPKVEVRSSKFDNEGKSFLFLLLLLNIELTLSILFALTMSKLRNANLNMV